MNILLCGIPLGRDNVGDEAILAGAVKIFRRLFPGAQLSVSTDDPATAGRLGIRALPLFGFDVVEFDPSAMRRELVSHDVVVWAGATGLSDYPEIPCALLRIAQEAGRRTVIWNVGMNSELNPAKYEVGGRKRKVFALVEQLSGGWLRPLERAEERLRGRAREIVRDVVEACDLVVTRDPESRDELLGCGVGRPVLVGADSALVLDPVVPQSPPFPGDFLAALGSSARKVGVCISAQRNIADTRGLLEWLDGLVESGCQIYFIPMNPVTDAALMGELRKRMRNPAAGFLAGGRLEPEEVAWIAGRMDVVVASRLHLLILASISHVPILGISRGSKVDNFLAPFGIRSSGSVESCDFAGLRRDVDDWSGRRDEFRERSVRVRTGLLSRLSAAERALVEILEPR